MRSPIMSKTQRHFNSKKTTTITGFYKTARSSTNPFASTLPSFRHIVKQKDSDFIKEFASKQNLVSKIISSTLQKISNDNEAFLLREHVSNMRAKANQLNTTRSSADCMPVIRKTIVLDKQKYITNYPSEATNEATNQTSPKAADDLKLIIPRKQKIPLFMHNMNMFVVPNHNKYEGITFKSLQLLSDIREKTEIGKKRFKFKY